MSQAALLHPRKIDAGIFSANLPKGAPQDGTAPTILGSIGTVSQFARNETVFYEGDSADYSFRVISGAVRLCKITPDGRRQIADFALPGEFFGFEWMDECSLSAEAVGELTVVRYAQSRLEKMQHENADVRSFFSATLRQNLWIAQHHLLMLGQQTATERMASFLLVLMRRSGTRGESVLDVPMGRQDIADYLGLTIETVCRVLSAFKRDKVIDIPNRREIVIRAVRKLHQLSNTAN